MKIEIDLPEDFIAWLDRQPLCPDLVGASVAEKVRFLLQQDIDFFHQQIWEQRHRALLKLLGVEHLIDVPRPDELDDDCPF